MNDKPEPILTDFTSFNPHGPDQPSAPKPTYKALIATAAIVLLITAAFFATVHFWG